LGSPNNLFTCKDFLRELNDYLDETLDPGLRAELERHVCECPNCWVVCDTTRKTIQVYKGIEPQPLPESVHNKLMSVLRKKSAPNSTSCLE
jgi:anti-sigma factor RsiW